MILAIIKAVGQVLLFCLIMNIVTGAIAGAIALQWYLMRKLEGWLKND